MPTRHAHPTLAPAVFVTGKGGVGKTLVAAGLALAAAETEGGAVLVEFGDGASGKRVLARKPEGLVHVVIDPARAVMKAATPIFGTTTLAKIALDNFAMRPLIRAAPAIRELAVLELARRTVAEHPGRRVVFDMPATGHSVAWLKVARQGRELTERGPIHDLCARLEEELLRPSRASIVVVTLPERLVLSETLALCDTIENEVGLSVDRLVVNRVPQPLPAEALTDARRLAHTPGELGTAANAFAHLLENREAVHRQVMDALDATVHQSADNSLTLLPLSTRDPSARDAAEWLREAGAA